MISFHISNISIPIIWIVAYPSVSILEAQVKIYDILSDIYIASEMKTMLILKTCFLSQQITR